MKKSIKRAISLIMVFAMVVTLCPQVNLADIFAADDNTPYCISYGRAAYSSSDNGNSSAESAVDGSTSTRWESKHGAEPQWFYVDLGKVADITSIRIKWEAAYAKSYKIQFSNDEENWEDVYIKGNVTDSEGETAPTPDVAVKYEMRDDGDISASWTNIDNANYKVCIGNENTVAKAPDGYSFTSHPAANGLISVSRNNLQAGNTYKLIVIALDKNTGAELKRGETDLYIPREGETLPGETEQETEEETEADDGWDDINITGQARYVRIYMTERATAYGYSFYEFQVYGLNGVTQRPVDYGTNLALNKNVACSGTRDEWWMNNGDNDEADRASVVAENAVDGDDDTAFTSYQDDNQWFYVDLGQSYEIGRIILKWGEDAGKIYDIDVSNDGQTWKTVYRRLNGHPDLEENLPIYIESARYIRMNGYTKVSNGSGFQIKELEVYEYADGDEKITYSISNLPQLQILTAGKATYVKDSIYLEDAKLPIYVDEENISAPIASNDWWQSAMIKKFGNRMATMPFKTGYSRKGLSILTATEGWVPEIKDTDVNISAVSEETADMYIVPENLDTTTAYDRVHDYSDYSVDLQLCDTNGVAMTSTHVKGSPYIYTDFEREAFYLSVPNLTSYFNDNGASILANGEVITTDHIGIHVTDNDNKERTNTSNSYYCITLPANTTVKNNGGKLKITFAGNDRYMSVGTMQSKAELNTFYQHGYAFVTDTYVNYTYDEGMSKITSNYNVTTEVKRNGFSGTTMQLMLPHQWKYSPQESEKVSVYTSVRGDMHAIWRNSFETVDTFEGLLPTFATPKSEDFDIAKVTTYLRALQDSTKNINPAADAYWEGKNVHPLAMGVLMADQIGDTELRDVFLQRLKARLVDWFTYDGEGDISYFVYDKHWGTIYYSASEFGANWGISDHHFTYGYFLFGATVLATYDEGFYNDYKEMIEILIRDYANPSGDDSEYCRFRAYDLYEGHSWAGGYADNDNGNNQESASESLFSWVSMYLWGVLTENDTYRDAGVFGFKNEMEAIEQYWFDYDEDNWLEDWPYEVVAQVYGGSNFYGTFFGGQPLYCYGIQWLPISEYLTYYGMDQERAAEIYAGLEADTERAANIALSNGDISNVEDYASPDNGWQHITWPFLSQTNPDLAMEKFLANDTKVQRTDQANTYWFIQSMKELGYKSDKVIATGDPSATVYYNEATDTYTATVWNPTNVNKTVTFKTVEGKTLGTADVGAKALLSFEIDTEKEFKLTQVSTPTIKTTSLSEGTVTENVTGNVTFDDTQLVELACADQDVTIYYTTDGSVPSTSSKVYDGKILVSSNTTVKAVAVKDGYIDSSYAAANFTIDGDTIQSSDNLALNKNATASSGESSTGKAVDGDASSRWESSFTDDEYFQVDLGSVHAINTVTINWETAYASKYELQVSTDGNTWTTVALVNGSSGEVTTTFDATKARYVRMEGISRATDYGYSFYEFEVYGALQTQAPTITPVSGTYNGEQTITMSTTVKGAEVKYTLDGSEPTEDSPSYISPFNVTKSTIVKAVTYRKGMVLSDVTESSIIIAGTLSLNKTEATIAYGRTLQLSAMTDQAVTWKSSNDSIAAVDQNGLVSGKTPGKVTITATAANGQTATCEITVSEPVHITSIELPSTYTMKNKTTETLALVINPANTTDDTTATWTTSDENVVKVSGNGTLTAKAEGKATITVKVGGFTATCEVTVGPAATAEEMVANEKYNVSLNKPVIISTIYAGEGSQDESVLVDGNLNSDYVSTDWDTSRTGEYIILDLGACYKTEGLDQVIVQYKSDNTYCENYEVQYSTNGTEYVTVAQDDDVSYSELDNGLLVVKVGDASDKIASTRYVKINLEGHKNWGFQIREAAVLSTEQNAEIVDVEECENPASFELSSNNFSEITYTIVAGEGQEDYTYNVYLNGEMIAEDIAAGTYTIKDIAQGTHTLSVYSHYNGGVSTGITKEIYVDDGSYVEYIDSERNIAKGCDVTLEPMEKEELEGSQDTATLVDTVISGGNGNTVQAEWGTKEAVITLDLGQEYNADEIEEVILAFKANNTYSSDYTIQFSADGATYETVYTATDVAYEELLEDKVDVSNYSQGTVRYVKINLNDGSYTWGYQIYEVAVISKDSADSGIVISDDVKVEGYQISTTYGGSRIIASVEPEINGKKVVNWGLVYAITQVGNDTFDVKDTDMVVGADNAYVASYQSTSLGTMSSIMGESETATYFARTMKFGANNVKAYTAEYRVRAYAVLEDGSYVYSEIGDYSVYRVASYLYENHLMNTASAHDYLYDNILTTVDSNYKELEYKWDNSLVQ